MIDTQRHHSISLTLFSIGVAGLAALGCGRSPSDSAQRFPGKHWKRVPPEAVGFDSAKLDAFAESMGGSGCVVKDGYMVKSWGHVEHPFDIASAVKPFYAHFVYMCLARGLIESLDAPVADHEPRLGGLNPELNYKDREITWHHLVTQTAGYGVSENPGMAFNYCDYQSALLIDTLVMKVLECGYDGVDARLTDPFLGDLIGCEDSPTLNGPRSHPGRMRISPRDFARFGLLYMAEGRWRGRQVVPRELAALALSNPHSASLPRTRQEPAERIDLQRSIGAGENQEAHLNSYSYMWWLNGETKDGTRVLPDAPADLFAAVGHAGGDALIVIPKQNIVLCWIDAMEGMSARRFSQRGRIYVNQAIARFMDALVEDDRPLTSEDAS